nr:unnamed protein product [Callosobruchus chinensis]
MCKSSNILCKNRVRRLEPWMTAGILTSVRERDKLKQSLANDKGNLESRQTHISYVNKLTYLLKKFKDDYYSQKFTNPGNGYRKTWDFTSKATNDRKSTKNVAMAISINVLGDSSPVDIANASSDIGDEIKMNHNAWPNSSYFHPINVAHFAFLAIVDKVEVEKIIANLRNNAPPTMHLE